MNKNQLPFVIFEHGAVKAAGDQIVIPDIEKFGRPAKRMEVWGQIGAGTSNDTMVFHINETVRVVKRNLETADTSVYMSIGEVPGVQCGSDFDQPYVFEAKDWGGEITSVRISAYGGAATDCTIKVS